VVADHLDEERIQRLLDRELTSTEEAAARGHAERCHACAGRISEARGETAEVRSLLSRLDSPVPALNTGLARVLREGVRERIPAWTRWVAGFALAFAVAGIAYALPGSPVRGWMNAVVQSMRGPRGGEVPNPETPTPDRSLLGGIAVAPGSNLVIQFTSPQAEGRARILLTDGPQVVVRAPSGSATYESGNDLLVIDNRGPSATFEIEIPRSAPRVEVRLEDSRLFLKEGTRAEPPLPTAPIELPLVPPGG
jgi:hypothetical protein